MGIAGETRYDSYNREERALCSHLFQILHDGLGDKPKEYYLKTLIDHTMSNLRIRPAFVSGDIVSAWNKAALPCATIYTEVALLRDAVKHKVVDSDVVREQIKSLNAPHHGKSDPVGWSYRGILSAKPDLVIAFPNLLLVFEIKFTLPFDEKQLTRTRDLVETWRHLRIKDSGLPLWSELGVCGEAPYAVLTIGDERRAPDLSWQSIFDVMKPEYLSKSNRTCIVFDRAKSLLEKLKFRLTWDAVVKFAEQGRGGFIGYAGGFSQLDKDLAERPDYVLSRRYQWVKGIDLMKNPRNWLQLDAFIKRACAANTLGE